MASNTRTASRQAANDAFKKQLNKVYGWYTGGFIAFVIVLAMLEQMGLPRNWIGFIFLLATVGLYAGIGIMSRTSDAAEYYVAGRRVPAFYNGMATGADWMSAASFIGMAGTLYLTGYGGLAFIMGWTGGYCLVALFLAPYLRKFGQFTIPDFLGARYGGNMPRFVGIVAAILCSFTYVVAQIYGVGLITTRLTGVAFELGIFLGLGGILVCSFLGGMRAVTWTQVAQYIILIIAYMIPVVWLSDEADRRAGAAARLRLQAASRSREREKQLIDDPKEKEVIAIFKEQADDLGAKLKDIPDRAGRRPRRRREAAGRPEGRQCAAGRVQAAREGAGRGAEGRGSGEDRPGPRRRRRPTARAKPLGRHAAACAAVRRRPERRRGGEEDLRRIAAQLPRADLLPDGRHRGAAAHPDALLHDAVGEGGARLGDLVAVLHLPAVLHGAGAGGAGQVRGVQRAGRHAVRQAAGLDRAAGPRSIRRCCRSPTSTRTASCSSARCSIGGDIIVLATPEIGGLPYVISGLVAAGGLAAALSTADGLLLTIANAL